MVINDLAHQQGLFLASVDSYSKADFKGNNSIQHKIQETVFGENASVQLWSYRRQMHLFEGERSE